jgi:hypothetical protein
LAARATLISPPRRADGDDVRVSTADSVRGTLTCVVVGVGTILTPASALPHKFGYYVAFATFVLGLRFGSRAIAMLLVCCVVLWITEATRSACTTDYFRCGVAAATPWLIFGYFVGPTIAGALVSGMVGVSRVARASRRGVFEAPRDHGALLLRHSAVVALAAAAAAFVAVALLPLYGAPLFLPSVAACVAFGCAPSCRIDEAPVPAAARSSTPTW